MGVERRRVLAGMAAATGAAWVAPSILTIDAAAAVHSTLTGYYRAQFLMESGVLTLVAPENGTGCNPNQWNNVPEYPLTITPSVAGGTISFTIDAATCTFALAPDVSKAKCGSTGNICHDGTGSPDGKTTSWSTANCTAGYVLFKLVIFCGAP